MRVYVDYLSFHKNDRDAERCSELPFTKRLELSTPVIQCHRLDTTPSHVEAHRDGLCLVTVLVTVFSSKALRRLLD